MMVAKLTNWKKFYFSFIKEARQTRQRPPTASHRLPTDENNNNSNGKDSNAKKAIM